MKKILHFLLLLAPQAALAQAPQLDSALAYLHDQALFNGTVLLAENDKVVYQKNYGITDFLPMRASSRFALCAKKQTISPC
jgi:hypothetical protein